MKNMARGMDRSGSTIAAYRFHIPSPNLDSQGYDPANINTISTKAGFAKGTIYNYFSSKQSLLLALIDSIAQEHLGYMRSAILSVDDPAGRLA